MKRIFLLSVFLFVMTSQLFPRMIKVDINGSGQFTSISAALTATVAGDTIKVLPGSYFEQVTVNKNVVIMGSGYETTIITSNIDPTINISVGKLQWFKIGCGSGSGINTIGGIVTNCVISGCSKYGVQFSSNSTGVISNCVIIGNGSSGVFAGDKTNGSVYNCISLNNASYGYDGNSCCWPLKYSLNYSCGSINGDAGSGNINVDPLFINISSGDFHISQGSKCWDTGKPDILDPDGSQSDMGYFGGQDCPVYPVVKSITLVPQPDGSVKIQATGVANY